MKRRQSGGPRPPEAPSAPEDDAPNALSAGEEYENFTADGADYAEADARGVGLAA